MLFQVFSFAHILTGALIVISVYNNIGPVGAGTISLLLSLASLPILLILNPFWQTLAKLYNDSPCFPSTNANALQLLALMTVLSIIFIGVFSYFFLTVNNFTSEEPISHLLFFSIAYTVSTQTIGGTLFLLVISRQYTGFTAFIHLLYVLSNLFGIFFPLVTQQLTSVLSYLSIVSLLFLFVLCVVSAAGREPLMPKLLNYKLPAQFIVSLLSFSFINISTWAFISGYKLSLSAAFDLHTLGIATVYFGYPLTIVSLIFTALVQNRQIKVYSRISLSHGNPSFVWRITRKGVTSLSLILFSCALTLTSFSQTQQSNEAIFLFAAGVLAGLSKGCADVLYVDITRSPKFLMVSVLYLTTSLAVLITPHFGHMNLLAVVSFWTLTYTVLLFAVARFVPISTR